MNYESPEHREATHVASLPNSRELAPGSLSFSVSAEDRALFARLPQCVRDDVLQRLHAMRVMAEAGSRRQGALAVCAQAHGRRGWSVPRLLAQFATYSEAGDWRVLIDRAKAGPDFWASAEKCGLPKRFLDYWRQLCEENQRKCKPAHRKLKAQWRAWRAGHRGMEVPGYDSCPAPAVGSDLPKGWQYSNLIRYRPTDFELSVRRQGRMAAFDKRPNVLTTRVGLEVGEFYLFDDLWHDFKVNLVGQSKAQRLLQFHALDLFSGCLFARGQKPITEDAFTGAQVRLKEVEMRFLVAHVLSAFGWRERGTTLVVEHGTAAIREDMERMLFDLSHGKIRVARSGLEGAPAIGGLYEGAGKGNWRFKAALESAHNLIHNETADTSLFPGQVGKDRDHQPEELHGREKHNSALLAAIEALPENRKRLLRLPFLEFHEAVRLVNLVQDQIDARTEHKLEGWIEAGLTANEFRPGPDFPWKPAELMAQLTPAEAAMVEIRTRRLSPAEVWHAGRRSLRKFTPAETGILLGPDLGREVRVRRGMIEFQDAEVAPEPLHFEARTAEDGRLADGAGFIAVANPMDLRHLTLFDGKGRFRGVAPRWDRVPRNDAEALQRACGRAVKAEAELLEPVRRRGMAEVRERLADARHNAQVLNLDRPATAEERQIARDEKRLEALAEDALSTAPADTTTTTTNQEEQNDYGL